MAASEEDGNILKRLLESIAHANVVGSEEGEGGHIQGENVTENVAQLLAAALKQVGQEDSGVDHSDVNPVDNVDNTVEVPSTVDRQRNLGIKFTPEIRRKIINYRKGGKRYRDIAKELGASVSGVQKVWERFLMTGTIGNKKSLGNVGKSTTHYDGHTPEEVKVKIMYLTDCEYL
jgi:hypothetical protein